MVSNVLVFVSVIAALNSAVLLVAWQGRCVCPVLQRGSFLADIITAVLRRFSYICVLTIIHSAQRG